MPMRFDSEQRPPATSGPSWTIEDWPFLPPDVEQQMKEDEDKPRAAERLYGRDGRLAVAPGEVLPDNADDLLTEDQVFGRAPIEPGTQHRRRIRKVRRVG